MSMTDWKSLLGKEVVVTLGTKDDAPVVASGTLIAYDEWGEARLLDDMGGVVYCWPMLDVKVAP